ncbi:hypothetical protein D3C73_1404100 [compost metagenome]
MLLELFCTLLIQPEIQLAVAGFQIGFGHIAFAERYLVIPIVQMLQVRAFLIGNHALEAGGE